VKLWLKFAAGIAAVAVVVAIALPFLINVNSLKPKLEEQLSSYFGRQTTVGNLSLAVLSDKVTASDLTIAGDPQFGQEPFVKATSITIGVHVLPLIFQRRILIDSIEVLQPRIRLIKASGNTWNISTLGQAIVTGVLNQGKNLGIAELLVKEFHIEDGHVSIEDQSEKSNPIVCEHLSMHMESFSFRRRFHYDLKATFPAGGDISVAGEAGPIDRKNTVLTPFVAHIEMHGVDPVAVGLANMSSGISMVADMDIHATSEGGVITSDGTLHTQHLRLRPSAAPAPKPIDVTYKLTHKLDESAGEMQNAEAQTGHVTGHLSGTYQLIPAPSVHMKLIGDQVPIDGIEPLLPALNVKLPKGSTLRGGTLTTHLSVTGTLQDLLISGPLEMTGTTLDGFDLKAKLGGSIAGVAAGDTGNAMKIENMRADLRATAAGLHVDQIFIVVPGLGEATGEGTVSPEGDMDIHMSAHVNSEQGIGAKALSLMSKIGGHKNVAAVPITITGSTYDPQISASVSGTLKNTKPKWLPGGGQPKAEKK
jgi:AsmA protein